MSELAEQGRPRAGAVIVAVAGAAWALLSMGLAWDGHAPSVTLLPIDAAHYYWFQAAVVVPLLFGLWVLASTVAWTLGRALGGSGTLSSTANPLAFALAGPLLALLLLPDAIAYLLAGFEALAHVVRITSTLTVLASIVLATFAVRAAHGVSTPRAFVAGLSGVLAQGLLGGVVLR